MKMCVIFLREEELLEQVVNKLLKNGIKNITMLNSTTFEEKGAINKKGKEINMFGSLRFLLNYYNDESRVILCPCKEEETIIIQNVIKTLVPASEYFLFVTDIYNVQGNLF